NLSSFERIISIRFHQEMMMNKWQRNNLEKLAKYLDSGQLFMNFDMDEFYKIPDPDDESGCLPIIPYPYEIPKNNTPACMSVGCAIGHGPSAGIRVRGDKSWDDYCHRVFGI